MSKKSEAEIEHNLRHDYVRIWQSLSNEYDHHMSQLRMQHMMDPTINLKEHRNEIISRILKRNILAVKTLGDIFRKLDLFKHYPKDQK
jgi:hypothetical protein